MSQLNYCQVQKQCVNQSRCHECSGSFPLPEALDIELPLLYVRKNTTCPALHPIQVERKRQKVVALGAVRRAKTAAPRRKNLSKLRDSQRNERNTRDAIVRQTLASGAVIGDGDSRLGDGSVGLDDKLQSRSFKQIVVKIDEVDKAREGRIAWW